MIITMSHSSLRPPRAHPRGFVLITAMWIAIALTAVVLILCREVSVESLAANQHLSQAKVEAAEVGAEQFVLSIVAEELITPGYSLQTRWQARQLGDCYFWVTKPTNDVYNEDLQDYGILDEASKIDINHATEVMLEYLPGLDSYPSIAAAIVDWRDADDEVTVNEETGSEGAETNYYQSTLGYNAKNNFFESVDELRLIAGLAEDYDNANFILYGADSRHSGTLGPNDLANSNAGMGFLLTKRGIMPYITVHGFQATNPLPGTDVYTDADGNLTTVPQFSTIDDITYQYPLDVNNTTTSAANGLLQELLTQYGVQNVQQIITATTTRITPQQGGTGGTGGTTTTQTYFTSIWDWIVNTGITSADLSIETNDGTPLFNLLTAIIPSTASASTTNTNTNTNTTTGGINTGTSATTSTAPATRTAKVNINTASLPVLMCIPGFDQTDAEYIIDYRDQNPVTLDNALQLPNISWLLDLGIEPAKLVAAGPYITGASTVFSADIVTVSKDDRAFKRVKIVVDATSGTPTIIYRRDFTEAGWPLDPYIRQELKAARKEGREPNLPTSGSSATSALGSR
jgi:DNA uptake protein ComE-like DNA-binding protein